MSSLSLDFFRTDYRALKAEISKQDDTLLRVMPTFEQTFKDGQWPYEVSDDAVTYPRPDSYSFSTVAMVCHAIFHWQKLIQLDTMSKRARQQAETTSETLSKHLVLAVNTLSKKVVECFRYDKCISKSNSFGRNDPFTLFWLSSCLASSTHVVDDLDEVLDAIAITAESLASKVAAYEAILKANNDAFSGTDHAFVFLYFLRTLKLLETHESFAKIHDRMREAFRKCERHFVQMFDKIVHRQIAFDTVNDAPFDAAELVFSLEGLLICKNPNSNVDLLQTVFDVITRRQSSNPYWRPLKPFVTNAQGFALLPISVEIANSLLRIIESTPEGLEPDCAKEIPIFKRYTSWVCGRLTSCVPKTIKIDLFGWQSEHTNTPGRIQPWETSQIVMYLCGYRSLLQKHLAMRCLDAVGLISKVPERDASKTSLSASDYWDGVAAARETNQFSQVCAELKDGLILPRDAKKPTEEKYSYLLYGPPGTGKTTLVEEVAKALNWKFVEISPSDFVNSGESQVEMRAKMIFLALEEQSKTVILFDEIDRLILDRESPLYLQQGDMFQFMTPSMLPKLRSLHDKGSVIFFINTNYEERIDNAAVRPGRIDKRLLVGPPDRASRTEIIKRKLGACPDLESHVAKTLFGVYGEICEYCERVARRAQIWTSSRQLHWELTRPDSVKPVKSRRT